MNDKLIDQLVTRDLDEAERRELLDWLDHEPRRWRHCALAFLEAQLWQETLDGVVYRSQNEAGSLAATPPASARRRVRPSLRFVSSVAAAVLVAFSLGLSAGSLSPWSITSRPQTLPLARNAVNPTMDDESGRFAPNAVGTESVTADAADSPPGVSLAHGDSRSPSVQTFAVLRVATKDSGTREIHVPVLEGPATAKRWLRPEPESLPDDVQQQLEQRGYQLQQRRKFLGVQLEDGRPAVIPVDQYQVKFVGHRSS